MKQRKKRKRSTSAVFAAGNDGQLARCFVDWRVIGRGGSVRPIVTAPASRFNPLQYESKMGRTETRYRLAGEDYENWRERKGAKTGATVTGVFWANPAHKGGGACIRAFDGPPPP